MNKQEMRALLAAQDVSARAVDCGAGIAYGVCKEADKEKRADARRAKTENELINERHHVANGVYVNGLGERIS